MNLPEEFHRGPSPRRSREGGTALVAGLILGLIVVAIVGWFGIVRPRKLEKQLRDVRLSEEYLQKQAKVHQQRQDVVYERLRRQEEIAKNGETVVDDPEGKLLWAKPEPFGPLELRFIPSGTLCLLEFGGGANAEPEHRKTLNALGPWGQTMWARLEALTGAQAEELLSVLAAIIVRKDGRLDVSCQVDLIEPWWTTEEFLRRFPKGTMRQIGNVDVIEQGDRAVLIERHSVYPPGTPRGRYVVCPTDLAEELVASADDPPMLVRDIEDLMRQSELARNVTIIVSTKFLEAAGADLFHGDGEALRDAFTHFVGREATAVMLSAKWGESFFVELRATPALGVSPRWLATTLQQRLDAAAGEVEQYVAAHEWPEYGRRVIERYPTMLRKVAEYTRYGEADRQAVLRAYLPAVAGHNLVMGAELLLTQAGGAVDDHAVGAGFANRIDAATTLNARLAAPMSLSFPRESLEGALELWSAESGVAAAIDGPAFQAAGITRNQSLELDLRDRPAGEVLVEILRRANPDRTAASAADPRQAVVYVVEPAAGGADQGRIIVTTRAAASERGRPLPEVFAVGGE